MVDSLQCTIDLKATQPTQSTYTEHECGWVASIFTPFSGVLFEVKTFSKAVIRKIQHKPFNSMEWNLKQGMGIHMAIDDIA